MAKKFHGAWINQDFVRLHSILDEARQHLAGSLRKTQERSDQSVILGEIIEVNVRMQHILSLPKARYSQLRARISALQSQRAGFSRALQSPSNMGALVRASRGFLSQVDEVLEGTRGGE